MKQKEHQRNIPEVSKGSHFTDGQKDVGKIIKN